MGIFIDGKVPVIVSATPSGWTITQANGSSAPFNSAMEPLIYSLDEPQKVTRDLRAMGGAGERDGAQRRGEYRTREQSPSREEYEAREGKATKVARSREWYRTRKFAEQTEMPQHRRRGHKRRERNQSIDCFFDPDLESEQSQANRFTQRHNSPGTVELRVGCGCEESCCRLPARPAKDPNRAGTVANYLQAELDVFYLVPPKTSKENSNAFNHLPVPEATESLNNICDRLNRCYVVRRSEPSKMAASASSGEF